MKKKIIALAVVVAMLAIGAISSTLAYFSDSEFNKNVMTVGNVDITQDEVFEDNINIQPGQEVEKEVTVNNIGQGDAYIRTFIAMEDTYDIAANVRVLFNSVPNCNGNPCTAWDQPSGNNDWLQIKVADEDGKWVEADGSTWTIYTIGLFDYAHEGLVDSVLPAGQSVENLQAIELKAGTGNDFYARSGEKYDVLVLTQAVQTGTFATAADAFEATFGDGDITFEDDATVAAYFEEYLGVDVEVFNYSDYPAESEWPVWQDAAGSVTDGEYNVQ